MAENKLKKEIIKIISHITERDIKRTDVKASFIQGVEVDSLMALEIIASLEKKYKIEISEEDMPKLGTLNDMVSLVEKLTTDKKPQKKLVKISQRNQKPKIRKQKSSKKH